ncbi:oxidation resistance protein 1 [Rhizophlyctis rosea]|nr:oxidation resistance protein 1 [Rhizophlyctis rosea]
MGKKEKKPKEDKKIKKSKVAPSSASTTSPISPIFTTPPPKPLELHDRNPNSDPVISREVAELIRPILPPLQREALHWDLLYSTDQHGMSLSTLFSQASIHRGPAVLAVKDDRDIVFGAFASETLTVMKGYYGNGAT